MAYFDDDDENVLELDDDDEVGGSFSSVALSLRSTYNSSTTENAANIPNRVDLGGQRSRPDELGNSWHADKFHYQGSPFRNSQSSSSNRAQLLRSDDGDPPPDNTESSESTDCFLLRRGVESLSSVSKTGTSAVVQLEETSDVEATPSPASDSRSLPHEIIHQPLPQSSRKFTGQVSQTESLEASSALLETRHYKKSRREPSHSQASRSQSSVHESTDELTRRPHHSQGLNPEQNLRSSAFANPLGRRIPGPAGAIWVSESTSEASPVLKTPDGRQSLLRSVITPKTNSPSSQFISQESLYAKSAWLHMCLDMDIPVRHCAETGVLKSDSPLLKYNSQYIRNGGHKRKVPQYIGIVRCMRRMDKETLVTLEDEEGEIPGYLHRSIVSQVQEQVKSAQDKHWDIREDAVLVLDQVSVFTPMPGKHYLNITQNNILRVYSPGLPAPSPEDIKRIVKTSPGERPQRNNRQVNEPASRHRSDDSWGNPNDRSLHSSIPLYPDFNSEREANQNDGRSMQSRLTTENRAYNARAQVIDIDDMNKASPENSQTVIDKENWPRCRQAGHKTLDEIEIASTQLRDYDRQRRLDPEPARQRYGTGSDGMGINGWNKLTRSSFTSTSRPGGESSSQGSSSSKCSGLRDNTRDTTNANKFMTGTASAESHLSEFDMAEVNDLFDEAEPNDDTHRDTANRSSESVEKRNEETSTTRTPEGGGIVAKNLSMIVEESEDLLDDDDEFSWS